MSTRQCPTGCGRDVRHGQLLCPYHWRRVPARLQSDVWRTWRAWSSDMGDADKMRAYTEASEAATSAAA